MPAFVCPQSLGSPLRRLPALLVPIAILVAGCGGSDEKSAKTFEESEFEITFEYPDDFNPRDDVTVSSSAGGDVAEQSALAVGDDKENLILIERYDLNLAVTEDNLEVIKKQLDAVVMQATGEEPAGKRVDAAGLPGYEYTVPLMKPKDGESRLIFLFKDKKEYELNCQSTPKLRDRIAEACDQALETLEVKK